MSEQPTEDLEQNPLFDTAFEEIVKAVPAMRGDAVMLLEHVRILMVAAWLRGVTWADEHPGATR